MPKGFTIASFSGLSKINANWREFIQGNQIRLCLRVIKEVLEALPEVLGCLRHVDIAILTEHDGEAVEVFGDSIALMTNGD